MLGAGLRAPGDAVDTGGASGGLGIYADRAIEAAGLFVAPAPLPGRWVVGGAMAALGASVDWLREDVLRGAVDAEDAAGGGRRRAGRGRRAGVPARTSRGSGRRCSTRRHAARSSG